MQEYAMNINEVSSQLEDWHYVGSETWVQCLTSPHCFGDAGSTTGEMRVNETTSGRREETGDNHHWPMVLWTYTGALDLPLLKG